MLSDPLVYFKVMPAELRVMLFPQVYQSSLVRPIKE